MVVATMTWLSDLGKSVGIGTGLHHHKHKRLSTSSTKHQPILGILSIEAARTMSRLVSLYRSLSEEEVIRLRRDVMKSQGVSYLTSTDDAFLLKLACIERMEELDRTAISVSRLGKKCCDPGLVDFEIAYTDLKLGLVDLSRLDFGSKEMEKVVDKMIKLISATSNLYAGLECLAEFESMERKKNRWKDGSASSKKTNIEFSEEKHASQKLEVQHLKQVSLWSQPFDKTVGFMARTVCIVYARMCVVFGPYISISLLPSLTTTEKPRHARFSSLQLQFQLKPPDNSLGESVNGAISTKSMPILPKPSAKHGGLLKFLNRETKSGVVKQNFEYRCKGKPTRLTQQASATTVGGSGLSLRYANVIILVERYLKSPGSISEYAREDLFQMLPASLKISVKTKLKNLFRKDDGFGRDESLAEGWRDGLKVILGWLAPMAHDTVRWMNERNFEKQNFDAKPMVLLLQTLFFADREKTDAAIVEVLVGLSCICRYEIHRSMESRSTVW